ncbi:MAG: hypothetical protein JWL77_5809 [Chthonomonadaceae bacterium]|nr:hypothetical protein [Chthonomonadaceae bacterium]
MALLLNTAFNQKIQQITDPDDKKPVMSRVLLGDCRIKELTLMNPLKRIKRACSVRWLALFCLLLAMTPGCSRSRVKDAAALAKQGTDTGTALATYYNARADEAETRLTITTARARRLAENRVVGGITAALLVHKQSGNRDIYLAGELKARRTPLVSYVYSRLDANTQMALSAYDETKPPDAELNKTLANGISTIIRGKSIYDANLFKDVKLSAGAEEMLKENDAAGQDTLFPNGALPVQRLAYFNRFLLDSAFPGLIVPDSLESLAQEKSALHSRAAVATAMANLCTSLGKLVDTGITTDVRASVAKLQTAVETANHHPLTVSGINLPDTPTNLLGKLSDFLVQQEQTRQFQRNLPALLTIINTLTEVFDKEKFLYNQSMALTVVANTYTSTDSILGSDPAVAVPDNRNKIETVETEAYAQVGKALQDTETMHTSLHAFQLAVEHFVHPDTHSTTAKPTTAEQAAP